MKKLLLSVVVAFTAIANVCAVEADYRVVPLPQSVTLKTGSPYVLDESRVIVWQGDEAMRRNAGFLAQYIAETAKINVGVKEWDAKSAKNNIVLKIDKKAIAPEGYTISVSDKGVVISSKTAAGVFYGIQTLRKSLPVQQVKASVSLPAVVISDAPRFGYRGMLLDCARHFFPVEFVKQYIDMLVLHNMNRFHWHVTDDQGWRIEIKKHPKLTEIGSVRTSTAIGRNADILDGKPHTGFYTQEQVRDIVKYAADRYVTIIPEIDMPGHMLAAMTAYPELGCTGGPYEVGHFWGVYSDILCAGNPKTYEFCKEVLDEICDLFPSEYIHIGGDEAPRTRWEKCPKCQKVIAEHGIKPYGKFSKEAVLQGYFTTEIQKYVASKGRKIIGWDELLEGNVDKTAIIMSWRGAEPGAEAAQKGHNVIMSPSTYAYFDYYQVGPNKWREPLLIGSYIPIKKTYGFEPIPEGASAEVSSRIFGVQANLWTEYIDCAPTVEYQVLPRMGAIAEVQWMQPEKKNYEDFVKRVDRLRSIYELKGYTYCKVLWADEFNKMAEKALQ